MNVRKGKKPRLAAGACFALGLLVLPASSGWAATTPIYKCFDKNLGLLYTDEPCKDGEQLNIRAGDADPKVRRKASRASNQWRWQRLSTFPMPTIAMINGYCFGGGFTQVCACDLAIAADDAVFGLSEVNWGILPGGIVSWNVTQTLNARDGMYYALTGDTFDGKQAKDIGFVNFSYPKAKLKEETVKLAKKLMEKSPAVLRYTKEGIRAVRFMNEPQAADYLNAKSDALRFVDKEDSRSQGMKQFLDEKSYRPGFGAFKRPKATPA